MLARAFATFLVLTLGGCSVAGLLPDWTSNDAAGPEPAYRFIIANRLGDVIGAPGLAGTFEISGVRRIESLKGASWVTCIKAQHFPLPPRYYAVFIQQDKLVDSRLSVVIDQCEVQSYAPFDWAAEANKPPAPR